VGKLHLALVDDEDFDFLNQWKWEYSHGYARRSKPINGQYSMHRVVVNPPKGVELDHIDGNKLNNQKSNLRFATRSENGFNRGKNKSNTSGYKGVFWGGDDSKRVKKWKAQITVNRKVHYLGRFLTKEEASLAYKEAAKKYHGEFARTEDYATS
jgi:hypothetical protein